MIRCQTCYRENLDSSRFCDQCGARLAPPSAFLSDANGRSEHSAVPSDSVSGPKSAQVTSVGIPPIVDKPVEFPEHGEQVESKSDRGAHSRLIIERGDAANTEFPLRAEESYIGRWDADNGIFPDVDLDAYDPDAKVSRRHARITFRGNIHMIEDLGSTNGTFINRGRRLLPGSPQVLSEGDEIIVGKTFLRFHVIR
jgi:FHA domain